MDLAECRLPTLEFMNDKILLPDSKDDANATAIANHKERRYNYVSKAMKEKSNIALAKSVLLYLSPYNFVICRNCRKKQDLIGQSCLSCGHLLLVDLVKKDIVSYPKPKFYHDMNQTQQILPHSSQSNRLRNMKHDDNKLFSKSIRGEFINSTSYQNSYRASTAPGGLRSQLKPPISSLVRKLSTSEMKLPSFSQADEEEDMKQENVF
jgi:hypothetical protein